MPVREAAYAEHGGTSSHEHVRKLIAATVIYAVQLKLDCLQSSLHRRVHMTVI